MIADIDHGRSLEEQGFAALISGTSINAEEIAFLACGGWRFTFAEALKRNLVTGLM
jgi:hypothetical protein